MVRQNIFNVITTSSLVPRKLLRLDQFVQLIKALIVIINLDIPHVRFECAFLIGIFCGDYARQLEKGRVPIEELVKSNSFIKP